MANGSSLLETSDGGENWVSLGSAPPGWLISRIAMLDRYSGWTVLVHPGSDPSQVLPAFGLARSTDGGQHWTPVAPPA